MKRVLFVFLAVACVPGAWAADHLDLRDNWRLQSSAQIQDSGEKISAEGYQPETWYPVTVPTTVLAAMVANQVYPDPFFGDNMTRIPGYKPKLWLVMDKDSPFYPSWWYRTAFDVPASFTGKQLVLHLDGVNYRANVWLNGKKIASNDEVVGMFRRFEFPVTGAIKTGAKNVLAVEVTAPGHIEEPATKTKQVEATTGWDDHNPQPPDLNMGIWQDVYVTASGPAVIRHPYVASKLDVPGLKEAKLTVSARLVNQTDRKVSGKLVGAIEEKVVFEQPVELGPNETKEVVFTPEAFPQLVIKNPRVWWPVNLGSQELYEVSLALVTDNKESDHLVQSFGIREATTFINDEGWRTYTINGRNVLIRGGAWMTSDMLLRLSRDRYEALVRYAREGNFNMLRSEGFSIRETEDFYNMCDKYGVMVTQQIFGRSIPDEKLAIACVDDMLLRIRNHPSLVHFLGHDETFPTDTLDAAYRDMIARYTPDRTYQPHSGAFDIKERFQTGGTRTGTLQVWTYAPPNHYYINKDAGAWGFAQSGGIGGIFSSYDSMRRMLPEEALWPPFTPAWSLHTVTQGGTYFDPVIDAINTRYGESQNLQDFLRRAWMLNYESARGMFEAYGRNKYSACGITTWKYDAAWPASPTWQYIDWYLSPTGGYYGAKKACEPLHIQYSYDDDSVWVVNTLPGTFSGLKATGKLLAMNLSEKWSQTTDVEVGPDGKTSVFSVEKPADISKTYFLWLQLTDKEGAVRSENFYWLSTAPDVPNQYSRKFAEPVSMADYTDLNTLPAVELKKSLEIADLGGEKVAKVVLENPTQNLALFVRLALKRGDDGHEIGPIYWSDNCLTLLPGAKKELTAKFAAKDQGEQAPVLVVDGWNAR